MNDNSVQIKNVTKQFVDNKKNIITALDDVSLSFGNGEFVSFVGPSGCGKTTLLRLMADLERTTSGSITLYGSTPEQFRKSKSYGMVFQSPVLYDWRNVQKNVELPLQFMKIPKQKRREIALSALEMVGLKDQAHRKPFQLSGGMQQRVGIARALALNPQMLLMDEPFSALDEFTREKLNDDLLDIWSRTHKTICFVTHNIEEAVYLSTKICVFTPHPGRLAKCIDVKLPGKRTRAIKASEDFLGYVKEVKAVFKEVNT